MRELRERTAYNGEMSEEGLRIPLSSYATLMLHYLPETQRIGSRMPD